MTPTDHRHSVEGLPLVLSVDAVSEHEDPALRKLKEIVHDHFGKEQSPDFTKIRKKTKRKVKRMTPKGEFDKTFVKSFAIFNCQGRVHNPHKFSDDPRRMFQDLYRDLLASNMGLRTVVMDLIAVKTFAQKNQHKTYFKRVPGLIDGLLDGRECQNLQFLESFLKRVSILLESGHEKLHQWVVDEIGGRQVLNRLEYLAQQDTQRSVHEIVRSQIEVRKQDIESLCGSSFHKLFNSMSLEFSRLPIQWKTPVDQFLHHIDLYKVERSLFFHGTFRPDQLVLFGEPVNGDSYRSIGDVLFAILVALNSQKHADHRNSDDVIKGWIEKFLGCKTEEQFTELSQTVPDFKVVFACLMEAFSPAMEQVLKPRLQSLMMPQAKLRRWDYHCISEKDNRLEVSKDEKGVFVRHLKSFSIFHSDTLYVYRGKVELLASPISSSGGRLSPKSLPGSPSDCGSDLASSYYEGTSPIYLSEGPGSEMSSSRSPLTFSRNPPAVSTLRLSSVKENRTSSQPMADLPRKKLSKRAARTSSQPAIAANMEPSLSRGSSSLVRPTISPEDQIMFETIARFEEMYFGSTDSAQTQNEPPRGKSEEKASETFSEASDEKSSSDRPRVRIQRLPIEKIKEASQEKEEKLTEKAEEPSLSPRSTDGKLVRFTVAWDLRLCDGEWQGACRIMNLQALKDQSCHLPEVNAVFQEFNKFLNACKSNTGMKRT